MKILVQWSQRNPQDWVEIDARDFSKLPKGPIPTRQEPNSTAWETVDSDNSSPASTDFDLMESPPTNFRTRRRVV